MVYAESCFKEYHIWQEGEGFEWFLKCLGWLCTNYQWLDILQYFESINCPVTSCIVTNNKSLLSAPELYDAIVFHFAPAHLTVNLTSHVRSSQQLYVGLSYESPASSRNALLKDNSGNLYNVTMTYRMDSDICT